MRVLPDREGLERASRPVGAADPEMTGLGAVAPEQYFGAAVGVDDFSTLLVRQKRRILEAFEQFTVFVFNPIKKDNISKLRVI